MITKDKVAEIFCIIDEFCPLQEQPNSESCTYANH